MFWPTLLASLTLTAVTGAALGAALGLTGLIILHFFAGGAAFLALDAVWNAFNSFTLSAIPLFIILGEILLQSGISRRVYTARTPVFQHVPGGLLHTNIAVCTVFGAVSGSSMSTAAAVGSVAYPEMARRGYHKPTVVGSLAGGGTLGLLIPPSLSLLIYGALTETSIGRLFMAGILPGLMLSALFMAYIYVRCARNRSLFPAGGSRVSLIPVLKGLVPIWLGVLVTIMIEIGQVTPPVGLNLSVLVAITEDEVGLGRAALATMPYWLLMLVGAVVLTLFPEIALVLPDLVF